MTNCGRIRTRWFLLLALHLLVKLVANSRYGNNGRFNVPDTMVIPLLLAVKLGPCGA